MAAKSPLAFRVNGVSVQQLPAMPLVTNVGAQFHTTHVRMYRSVLIFLKQTPSFLLVFEFSYASPPQHLSFWQLFSLQFS